MFDGSFSYLHQTFPVTIVSKHHYYRFPLFLYHTVVRFSK